LNVPSQAAALGLMTEANLEGLQPRDQPGEPHRRGVIEHRAVA
jgi:hypothetical protein